MNNNRQSRMTKGNPDQFADALKRKISELGCDIESCDDVINAASDLDEEFNLENIYTVLYRNIGSRAGCIRALIVNLGDGGTGLIFQDDNSGDYCMAKMYDEIHADAYDTTSDMVNEVLSTWGKKLTEDTQPDNLFDDDSVDAVEETNNDDLYDVETTSGEVVSGEIIADYEAKRYSGSETIISQLKLTNGRTVWAVWNPMRGIYSQVDKNNYKIFNKVESSTSIKSSIDADQDFDIDAYMESMLKDVQEELSYDVDDINCIVDDDNNITIDVIHEGQEISVDISCDDLILNDNSMYIDASYVADALNNAIEASVEDMEVFDNET